MDWNQHLIQEVDHGKKKNENKFKVTCPLLWYQINV